MNKDKNKDKISKNFGFQVKNKENSSNNKDQKSSVSLDMKCQRKCNESDEQQPTLSVENNDLNSSLHLQTSYCSTHSNESDLSIALELELNAINMNVESDELPAFQIRTMSPLGRSPSPIDTCNISQIDIDLEETPTRLTQSQSQYRNPCQDNPNFVALHEINAQISPPSEDGGGNDINNVTLSRTSSLETIFENILLHTPPQHQRNNGGSQQKGGTSSHTPKMRRYNVFERLTMNRLLAGKENHSPISSQTATPKRHIIPHKVGPKEELQLSPSFTEKTSEILIDSNKTTQVVVVASAASTATAVIDSNVMTEEWNENLPKIE